MSRECATERVVGLWYAIRLFNLALMISWSESRNLILNKNNPIKEGNAIMNTNIAQGNWTEIKGKIKTQWAKLSDNEIEGMNGNLEQLAGKIQKAYGYGKEQGEREFNDFKKTINVSSSQNSPSSNSSMSNTSSQKSAGSNSTSAGGNSYSSSGSAKPEIETEAKTDYKNESKSDSKKDDSVSH